VELDKREEDTEYDFTSHDYDVGDNDNGVTTTNKRRLNVFSKIPRVGRRRWSTYDTGPSNSF